MVNFSWDASQWCNIRKLKKKFIGDNYWCEDLAKFHYKLKYERKQAVFHVIMSLHLYDKFKLQSESFPYSI
jgi:hypothetical protein